MDAMRILVEERTFLAGYEYDRVHLTEEVV